jgi:hypothetical protein
MTAPSSHGFELTTDGESVLGPVTADQLRQWRTGGKLPARARARRVGGDGSWTPIDILLASLAQEVTAIDPVQAVTSVPVDHGASSTPVSSGSPGSVSFDRALDRGRHKRVMVNARTSKVRLTIEDVSRGDGGDNACLDGVRIHGG